MTIHLYAQGFIYILGGADRHHYPKLELAGLSVFFTWVGAVAAAQSSMKMALLWLFVSHAVSGVLHVQIVLSHWSMETYKGSPYTSSDTEWYKMQLRTTMNVWTPPLTLHPHPHPHPRPNPNPNPNPNPYAERRCGGPGR